MLAVGSASFAYTVAHPSLVAVASWLPVPSVAVAPSAFAVKSVAVLVEIQTAALA